MSNRVESIDILRGLDLFLLVALAPMVLAVPTDSAMMGEVKTQLTHCYWQGFRVWDVVMPLFMFTAGASIPFALVKFKMHQLPQKLFWMRIFKRVALLWIFGMVVQGNLLKFENIKLFSNTLQAIAVGYLFSAVIFVYLKKLWWWIIGVGLLLGYWAIMYFGAEGQFGEVTNFAMSVDRAVLERFMDGASVSQSGIVEFAGWYLYAWIVPSINFVVTVMMGVIAGDFIKNCVKYDGFYKFWVLLGSGITSIYVGWFWDSYLPVVKPIWTSSMVLVSGGWCLVALAVCYYLFDVAHLGGKWSNWLKIYGMNSIAAYVLSQAINWSSVVQSIFGGVANLSGQWSGFVLNFGGVAIVFFILWLMYRNRVFLKV